MCVRVGPACSSPARAEAGASSRVVYRSDGRGRREGGLPRPLRQEGSGVFAALGRFAYRRRKLIVVLWSLAFAAGLVASLSVAAQLKGCLLYTSPSPRDGL